MMYDLQKANMWKRIPAFIFDAILLGILAVGVALLLSLIVGYDAHPAKLEELSAQYEEQYDVSFDLSMAEYEKLSDAEKARYDEATRAMWQDSAVQYAYSMMINLTLLITSFGVLIAYLILEFLVPALFGNGQTLGKKAFGIGVMRSDGVKITLPILFIRTVLAKYTFETMVPILLLIMLYFGFIGSTGLLVIGAILLLQIILVAATSNRTALHDVIAHTVTVDMASQMIFDTQEDMIAYKKRLHAEEAAKRDS